MAQIASIALADAQSPAITHTFTPQNAQNGTTDPALLLNRASGVYAGFERLTVLVRRSESNKASKVSIKLIKPTLAVTAPTTTTGIQPAPSVAYTCIGDMSFTFPDSCTLQERSDIRAMLVTALGSFAIKSAIEDLSPLY